MDGLSTTSSLLFNHSYHGHGVTNGGINFPNVWVIVVFYKLSLALYGIKPVAAQKVDLIEDLLEITCTLKV